MVSAPISALTHEFDFKRRRRNAHEEREQLGTDYGFISVGARSQCRVDLRRPVCHKTVVCPLLLPYY